MSVKTLKLKKLGEILMDVGLLSSEQLDSALGEQKKIGKRLGDILVDLGFVTEKDIVNAYSVQLGIPYENLTSVEISLDALEVITEDFAVRHGILPLNVDGDSITISMSDPLSIDIKDSIAVATGKDIKVVVSTPTEIRKAIQQFYQGRKPDKLGEILVNAGLITEEQLALVLNDKKNIRNRIGEVLVEKGYVSESDMVQALSVQLDIPYTDLSIAVPEHKALEAIPGSLASKHLILPLAMEKNSLTVVMANPLDIKAVNAMDLFTNMKIKVTVSTHTDIRSAIDKCYSDIKPGKLGNILVDASLVNSKEYAKNLKDVKKKLGEILLKSGLITDENLSVCLEIQKESKKKLGRILVEYGYLKETEIVKAISKQMEIPYTDLKNIVPDTKAFEAVPVGFAERLLVLPLSIDKKAITIAMANPFDTKTINDIAYTTGKDVKVAVSGHIDIRKAIQQFYRKHRPKKLGEILIEVGFVRDEHISICLKKQKKSKKMLGEILVEEGYVKEDGIAQAFSKQMGIPYTDLASAELSGDVLKSVPQPVAKEHLLIPLCIEKRVITIAMANPLDIEAITEIKHITGKSVKVTVSTSRAIKKMILQSYQFSDSLAGMEGKVEVIDSQKVEVFQTADDTIKKTESQPIVRIVNSMITEAVKMKASDIHLEVGTSSLVVRNRVDGLLRVVNYLPKWVQWPVISRIKIMSKLDIAERRIPQDGRIKVKVENKEIDLRVSTVPSQYGEKVVIRLLDPTTSVLNIKDMGLSKEDYHNLTSIIEKPQGIVLVTGPTGSGKTSTLYAMINHIKDTTKNIVTLEDPIEYELEGINQIGINERLPFASALRAVLRQDPDVILIGEMRDSETANIAVQASITGHLVISTIHTNTAAAAISRLKNFGIKPFMIASSLNGIIAQRLVRKVCKACKQPYEPIEEDLLKLGMGGDVEPVEKFMAYKGSGCPACNKTGYSGRSGVFEILKLDSKIRGMIVNEADEALIVQLARKSGMKHMLEDGIEKVRQGSISMFDLPRVVSMEKVIDESPVLICRSCGKGMREDFRVCPFCGEAQFNKCTECNGSIKPEWKYCPYCRKKLNRPED